MSRFVLHLSLFVLTFATATFAGGLFWGGSATFLGPDVWRLGLPYSVPLLAILGAHEMGHYAACRRYGIRATLPFFLPGVPPVGTFGALIRIRAPIPNRRALFDVAAAGPIAGFLVALPVLVAGILTAEPSAVPLDEAGTLVLGPPILSSLLATWIWGDADLLVGPLYGAAWVGMLVTSMNLFPVGQLDGGHAAYAISRRLHRFLSWGTLGALLAFVTATAVYDRSLSGYALWLLILSFLRDRHPRLVEESVPLGRGRLAVAVGLAILFVLSFIPVPFRFVEP